MSKLRDRLEELGIRSKSRVSGTGGVSGNAVFSRGSLYEMLQNPLYLGEIRHKQVSYPGHQVALIERELWDAVRCPGGGRDPLPLRLRFKIEGREQQPQTGDKALIGAIVKSRVWPERILSGEVASQRELAAKKGYDERYVSRLLIRSVFEFNPRTLPEVLPGRNHFQLTAGSWSATKCPFMPPLL